MCFDVVYRADARKELCVCLAIGSYAPAFSGHAIHMERLRPYLRAEGVEMDVLTRRPYHPVPPEEGVHRVLRPGFSTPSKLPRALDFHRFLRRHGHRYDVLHSVMQGWEFLLNLPYLPYLRRRGIPVLLEMVLLGADDPVTISHMRTGAWKLRLLEQVDLWSGLSEAFRERCRAVGIPKDRFRVVHSGVDVDLHRPMGRCDRDKIRRRLRIPEEARVAVTVGAVIHRKGIDRLVAAWERLAPRPERDLLLIAGPVDAEDGLGPEDLAFVAGIRRIIEAPRLAGTVRLLGRTNDIPDLLAAADVFVFLSRREGLGVAVLEAMAAGLPCVVSPLDGIAAEMIDSGSTGWIVNDPDNADRVARKLQKLLEDAELRGRLGGAARTSVVQRFSMQVRAQSLRRAYEHVLCRQSPVERSR